MATTMAGGQGIEPCRSDLESKPSTQLSASYEWSTREESNFRKPAYQTGARPLDDVWMKWCCYQELNLGLYITNVVFCH